MEGQRHSTTDHRRSVEHRGSVEVREIPNAVEAFESEGEPAYRSERRASQDSVATARRSSRSRLPPVPSSRASGRRSSSLVIELASKRPWIQAPATSVAWRGAVGKVIALNRVAQSPPRRKASGQHRQPFAVKLCLKEDRLLIEQELVQLPIFQGCSHDFVCQLSQVLGGRSLHVGHDVVEQGTPASSMVVILRGSVQMLVGDLPVYRLSSGSWFGETVLLGLEDRWRATLKAETPCTVMDLPRANFLEVLHSFPPESRAFHTITMKHRLPECQTAGTLSNRIDLFHGLSDAVVHSLDEVMVPRLFFPKEKILEEGAVGDELYILVRGKVIVEIAGRTIRHERRESSQMDSGSLPESLQHRGSLAGLEQPPQCYGELGLLGMTTSRTATIMADSVCQVRVLFRPLLLRTLEHHRESVQGFFKDFLTKHGLQQQKASTSHIRDIHIFKESGCGANFLDFLTTHLEGRVYLPGQKIVDENQPDDGCMYLLSQGSAELIKDFHRFHPLQPGSVFGHMPMFGLNTKLATVIAELTCHVQVLHRGVVLRGLELFPEERQKVMSMALKNSGVGSDSKQSEEKEQHEDVEKEPPILDHKQKSDVRAAFLQVLKSSPLFAKTNPAFVDELSAAAVDRIYMPGDLIIEEGQRGDSMFIMVSGQAGVFVSDPEAVPTVDKDSAPGRAMTDCSSMARVGMLSPGGISGELAMLGVSPTRSATIKADQICSMWEITQEKALVILDRFPDSQKHFAEVVVQHLERTAPARVSSLPLFRSFDAKFRVLLGLYCERRAFFPNQVIAREGQLGSALHIVNIGVATLKKKGVVIKTYSCGSHFGSTVMLGIHKAYLGTLVVLQTCHVLSIPRCSFLQALETYPSVAACQELKRTESLATEELRQAIQRISARKLIWRRYQHLMCEGGTSESSTNLAGVNDQSTGLEMLIPVLQQWYSWASTLRARREKSLKERAQYERMMTHWMRKHLKSQERVQRRREEAQRREQSLTTRLPMPRPLPNGKDFEELVLTPEAAARAEAEARAAQAMNHQQEQLAALISDWPAPRLSPHYDLKVWKVLEAVAGEEKPRSASSTRMASRSLGATPRTCTPRSGAVRGPVPEVMSARLSRTR